MINSVPIVHAQSIFPVPRPPTSQIVQQPGTIISVGNGQLVRHQGNCILTAGHGQLTINCNPTPPPGQAPIANAGINQVISRGSLVTLDGTGSHATASGATIVSYSWVQTSGIAVALSGANTARPVFTAPTNTTALTFSLTVTDSNGAVSSPSTAIVTVT